MTDVPAMPRARLVTAFGTVVYVDDAGELRHGAIETSPANAFFVADADAQSRCTAGFFVHATGVAEEPIVCRSDGSRLASRIEPDEQAPSPTRLAVVPLERGLIAFTAQALFLCAVPDGRVTLSGPRCSTWELFLASEDWCGSTPTSDQALLEKISPTSVDQKAVASYVVHPIIRARAGTKPKRSKLLIYGYTQWSHGRVYYDLCKHLHQRGYVVDILDWRVNHADYIDQILPYYDVLLSALDGIRTLTDAYGVPPSKIIALSHHEFDIRMLVEQKGLEIFSEFAGYGVVSEFMYGASLMSGVKRVPRVVPLGINYSEFHADVSERLQTVGYASSMWVETYGVEWKRGALAEAAAREAGLPFKVAGQLSFHDMPEFYRTVDAVLTSSLSESAGLPAMEAAAAGRLVISTPVGQFPLNAYRGGGIMAPIEADKFTSFAAATLRYYQEHPEAYVAKCQAIQEAARQFDWRHSIDAWVEFIDAGVAASGAETHSHPTAHRNGIEPTAEAAGVIMPVEGDAEGSAADAGPHPPASPGCRKAVVCDVQFLAGYICYEHYYLIKMLRDDYGFDIIDSKTTELTSTEAIRRLNTYDVLLIAYQGYVDIAVEQLSSRKIFRIDDLVNYHEGYEGLLQRLIGNADMIISPYAYTFHRHYNHRNVVWLPYSSDLEAYGDIAFNEQPIPKVLVSGSVAWDRPFRQFAAGLKNDHVHVLPHPGYGRSYEGKRDEIVGARYLQELNKYLCCFTDAHKYRYMHPKNFEIASVGSLLLADRLIEKELNELGFVDDETCIFADEGNFLERVTWICDEANRAQVDGIRRAGMKLAKERHLTRHRAKELNAIIDNATVRRWKEREEAAT
jgi:glycosyltransferase involved in cell wall biosynthesis